MQWMILSARSQTMPGPPASRSRRHILVVEDNQTLAIALRDALERAGLEVIGPAPSVACALSLLAQEGVIDGAILDIDLQGRLSFPVADALQARGIPFVFTTGHEMSILPASYCDVPRFEKPFDLQDVLQAILPSSG
jgi:DNA-binding NtrC family response regulator